MKNMLFYTFMFKIFQHIQRNSLANIIIEAMNMVIISGSEGLSFVSDVFYLEVCVIQIFKSTATMFFISNQIFHQDWTRIRFSKILMSLFSLLMMWMMLGFISSLFVGDLKDPGCLFIDDFFWNHPTISTFIYFEFFYWIVEWIEGTRGSCYWLT